MNTELEDFLAFTIERERRLRHHEAGEPGGMRYGVVAYLGGREFQRIKIDVAFADPLGWKPDRLRGPNLLAFAELEPVEVPVVPLLQHIAEKVHAMSGTYSTAERSSRAKDLVVLVLISSFSTTDALLLREALEVTFGSRKQHTLPPAIPEPPADWKVPFARDARAASGTLNIVRRHLDRGR